MVVQHSFHSHPVPINRYWLPPIIHWVITLLLTCGSIPVDANTQTATPPLVPVSLQLNWKHQFEFAGIYAAIAQGYYRQHGLEVTLREYQPGQDIRATVLSGQATYGLTNSHLIAWRLAGQPVTLLANYFKKPPLVILSQLGIRSLEELRGKRLMISESDLNSPLIQVALREAGLVPGHNITIVPHRFNTRAFMRKEVDAMAAFLSNEPFELIQQSIPFQVIELAGYVPGVGDGYLFTTETESTAHPEQTRAFIAATNQGWQYALAHPQEIIEIILTRYSQRKSRDALQYEADHIRHFMLTELNPIGFVSPNRIALVADELLEIGLIGDRSYLEQFIFTSATETAPLMLTPKERQWLATHPKIVFGTERHWAPFVRETTNGDVIGIEPDLLKRIRSLTGLEIQLELGNWPDIVSKAERGELDGLALSAAHSERMEHFLFTNSAYSIARFVFVRNGLAAPPQTMAALHGKRVGYFHGNLADRKLLAQWPSIIAIEHDYDTLIAQLLTGRLDAILSSPALFPIWRSHFASEISAAFAVPESNINLCYSVRRDYPELHSILNKALAAIGSDTVNQLLQQWGAAATESIPPLPLTVTEQAWLLAHPQIVLGSSIQFQPDIIAAPDGGYSGLMVDYVERLNRQLGGRLRLHIEQTWQAVITKAEQHQIDGLASATPNPSWDQLFLYTDPYYYGYLYYYTLTDQPALTRLEQLTARRVGYLTGMKKVAYLLQTQPDIIAVPLDTNEAMAQALVERRVDALIGIIDFERWRQHNSQFAVRMAGVVENSRHPVVMAIDKNQAILVSILNKALRNIPADEHERLRQRWFTKTGPAITAATTLLVSVNERQWLAQHPVVRYGLYPDWSPIEYRDEHGHVVGIVPEYLAYLTQVLGVTFQPVPIEHWAEGLRLLERGAIDLLPALAKTMERAQTFHFTAPYLTFPVAIFAPIDAPFFSHLDALAGKRVGVIADYTLASWFYQDQPALNVQSFLDIKTALKALAAHDIDAVVAGLVTTSHALSQYGLTNIRVAGITPYETSLGIAVRHDWAPLATLLTQALAAMPDHEQARIQRRWIQITQPPHTDYTLVWQILVIGGVILLVILYWNHKLLREIQRRLRAEQTAIRHQSILRATLDATDAGIVVTNAHNTVLTTNVRFQELWQVPDDVIFLGQESALLTHLYSQLEVPAELTTETVRESPQSPPATQDLLYLKDGSILERYTRALMINNESAWLWSFRDITDYQALQRLSQYAKETAEQTARAKSNFLANMSHEIRTPLNAVMGMLHVCLESTLTPQQRRQLTQAYTASQSLLALLNDLLDFSRMEAGRLTLETVEFDLDVVLNHVVAVIGYAAEIKGLTFTLESTHGCTRTLLGDPLRLEQILTNLADNAVKFTDKGTVRIGTRWRTIETSRGLLELWVQDTGIGIAAEQRAQLFVPFCQGDNSSTRRYGGTGLGLAICQRLVDMMGGEMTVESQLGQGSTFRFQVWFTFACTAALPAPVKPKPLNTPMIMPAPPVTAIMPQQLTDELRTLLTELCTLVHEHDLMAEELVLNNQAQLMAELPAALVQQLTMEIENYQFVDAGAQLDRLLSTT